MRLLPRLRRRAVAVGLLGVWVGLGAAAARGAEVTLVADAHVNSAMPVVNSGAISNLDVGGGYTALLQFDLSLLPAGTTAAQVSRAVLRLYANRVTTPGLVSLAPVTGVWGEYSVTYATAPAVGSAAEVFSVSGAGAFSAVDVTALVQGWVANPASNNGVALSAGTAVVQFDSKENDLTSHAATLDVELVDARPAGAAGPAGPQGPQGPMGALGATGPAGAVGPAGAAGIAGPAGAAGATGAQGPIGPAGATGAAGAAGAKGATGAVGINFRGGWVAGTGYAANDAVTFDGSTYLAVLSNSSSEPDLYPVAWTVLAQAGGVGLAGAAGAMGMAATVSVGTVSTGATGSQAAVSNSGSSSAAVLNFTIPQGAPGASGGGGGGGGGGGTSGIPFASTYHAVSYNDLYYSVNSSSSALTELAPELTWVPLGCTATALNVYSEQANTITVTLRAGAPGSLGNTALSCSAAPGGSCVATGSVAVAGGSFVDLSISDASGTAEGVWTALACN